MLSYHNKIEVKKDGHVISNVVYSSILVDTLDCPRNFVFARDRAKSSESNGYFTTMIRIRVIIA
jgi:hypothetical protein